MDQTAPRWKLRYANFIKAEANLSDAIESFKSRPLSIMEQAGLIQLFEITWDLGWKVLRDYLRESGVSDEIGTPISAIRAAFAAGLIEDGQAWIDATRLRNALSHEYDPSRATTALTQIADAYLALFATLREKLRNASQQSDLP